MAKIEIYTKKNCSYCVFAKDFLDKKGVSYTEIPVDRDAEKLQEMLQRCQGRRTVPQIIINDKAIGGYDDLIALSKKGSLDEMI